MKRPYLDLDGTQETRDRVDQVGVELNCEGEIPDIEAVPDVIGLLLEAAMGTKVGNVYTLADGTLPSLTLEKAIGSTKNYRFKGMKVNELSLSSRAGETLKITARMVGKERDDLSSPAARSYSGKKPFCFYQGVFKVDTVEARIREFELTLANNLLHPNFQSGDIYTAEQVEGVRDITGSFLLDFSSTAFIAKHIGVNTGALELLFTSGGDSLKIELKKVLYPEWTQDENDQIYLQRVNFRALRYDGTDKAMKMTLVSA
jgi:hypothetical protein